MATSNSEAMGDIDFEILALFDDASALSQMENILNNPEFYELLNIPQIQTPPTMENCETNKNNERQNNETNNVPNQNEEKNVFAIPKLYCCMYCKKRFYNQMTIRKHQLKHAKEQLRCPKCRVHSYTFGILRRHRIYYHEVNETPYFIRLQGLQD